MKKLFYLLLVSFIIASCTIEKKELHYTVKVNIDTLVDGYAYLQKRIDGKYVKYDSALSENGIYEMQGIIDFPTMQYFYIKNI